MDGVGSAASLLSLCEYIVRAAKAIKETLDDFKNLPQSIAEQTRYLNGLASIVDSVAQNHNLHTDAIVPHLQLIQEHITSLQELLAQSLQRAQRKTLKTFSRALFKRDKDKQDISAFLDTLERDKSNLNLYVVTKFGPQHSQNVDMNGARNQTGRSQCLAPEEDPRAKDLQLAKIDRQDAQKMKADALKLTGASVDQAQAPRESADNKTQTGSMFDNRIYGEIKSGEGAEGTFGDKGFKTRITSGLDDRKYQKIELGPKSRIVLGDVSG